MRHNNFTGSMVLVLEVDLSATLQGLDIEVG